MIRNYVLATVRILAKEKLYTLINAIGLSIGLATCFLIYAWVDVETSYDSYSNDDHRVYRLITSWKEADAQPIASTYPMVRPRILTQFPEVEESTRLFNQGFLGSKTKITYQDKVFTDNEFYYADSTFFRIFPFRLLRGKAATVLNKPNTVVLTEETASNLFGNDDPIGKTILAGTTEFEVTGVVENIPATTHFHFDVLATMLSHPWIKNAENSLWSGVVFHTYLKLKSGTAPDALEEKISRVLNHFPNDPEGYGKGLDLQLQPVNTIHLRSNLKFELEPNGDITYVYLFVTIGLLVIGVAIINYTNLATARHTQRFKEVAVRKVLGASRKQLITQFLTESFIITLCAFILAAILVGVAGPFLQNFSGHESATTRMLDSTLILATIGTLFLIGFATGFSPAFVLSAFKPVSLFKGNAASYPKGITLRKILIVSQFTVSIALTLCTAITYSQLKFLQDAKLGYQADHTVVLNIGFNDLRTNYKTFKSELSRNSNVLGITATSQLPTDIQTGENIDISKSETIGVHCVSVDPDFFRVMGIKILQGEQLISSIQENDSVNFFVLNESALRSAGWNSDESLKKIISIRHGNQKPGPVMGIISDFHFQSLHHAIEPLVVEFNPDLYQYLLIRVSPNDVAETLDFISDRWQALSGGIPFDYMFLDQEYDKLYKNEQRSSFLLIAFSVIAVLVSLMGLFGLSSFAVERRTKEIGVRKILGANVSNVLILVSQDFLVLMLVAFIVATPIGFYYMNTWMTNFAFQARIGPGLFLACGLINILLGLLTLSYHSIRIAKTNPIETLRYE